MKRSEIKVGAVLYWTATPDWEHARWGSKRVKVLDTERMWKNRKSRFGFDRGLENCLPTTTGTGVKVIEVNDVGAEKGRAFAVQPGHLKGEYDTIARQVEANLKAQQEHQIELDLKKKAKTQATQRVSRLVNELVGHTEESAAMRPVKAQSYHGAPTKVEVPPEMMLAMAQALQAQGWTYDAEGAAETYQALVAEQEAALRS